jgi:hypothetical protein
MSALYESHLHSWNVREGGNESTHPKWTPILKVGVIMESQFIESDFRDQNSLDLRLF